MVKADNYVTTKNILIPVTDGSDKVVIEGDIITKDSSGNFNYLKPDVFYDTHELPNKYAALKSRQALAKQKKISSCNLSDRNHSIMKAWGYKTIPL